MTRLWLPARVRGGRTTTPLGRNQLIAELSASRAVCIETTRPNCTANCVCTAVPALDPAVIVTSNAGGVNDVGDVVPPAIGPGRVSVTAPEATVTVAPARAHSPNRSRTQWILPESQPSCVVPPVNSSSAGR